MKYIFFLVLILVLIYFELGTELAESNTDQQSGLEIRQANEKNSDIYAEKYKEMNTKLNEFYGDEHTMCQRSLKNCENLLLSVDNYVQRYVSLFLITSNLHEYVVLDVNEDIRIDLEISITGQDLAYLQGYSKSSEHPTFKKSFSKLDGIFSKIARQKERSTLERTIRFFFSNTDIFSALEHPTFFRIFCFLMIFTVVWAIRRYFFTKSMFILVFSIVNSNILWEGLLLYWRKIKEADVKLYVETMQMKKLAEECQPENAAWYDGIMGFFGKDKCVQYYQTLAKNPVDEVSLFMCILETYAFYLLRMPVRLFGTSIRDLTDQITGPLPWPFYYFVNIPLGLPFVAMGGCFILILCGKRLKLSFFGAAVEIGDVDPTKSVPSVTDERAKPIRRLKPLKPWTKSSSSASWIEDCGKKWKSLAKYMTDQEGSNVNSTVETPINKEIKQD